MCGIVVHMISQGGFPKDQSWFHIHCSVGVGGVFDVAYQFLHRLLSESVLGHLDRCEPWLHELAHGQIVKAEHLYIVGNRKRILVQRLERSDSEQVVEADYRGKRQAPVEGLVDPGIAILHMSRRGEDVGLVHFQVVRMVCLLEALEPVYGIADILGAGDIEDFPMAVSQQMVDRQGLSLHVPVQDGMILHAIDIPSHEYVGDGQFTVEGKVFLIVEHRGDNQAIDLPTQQQAYRIPFIRCLFFGVDEQDAVVRFPGFLLDALDDFGEEGVGGIGGDYADGPRPVRPHAACDHVGDIAHLVGYLPDGDAGCFTDPAVLPQCPGDGVDRETGSVGDIF